jgi:hypothetical protein
MPSPYWTTVVAEALAFARLDVDDEDILKIAEHIEEAAASGTDGPCRWSERVAEIDEQHNRAARDMEKKVAAAEWEVLETAAEFLRCQPTDVERVQTASGPRWVRR